MEAYQGQYFKLIRNIAPNESEMYPLLESVSREHPFNVTGACKIVRRCIWERINCEMLSM